MQDIDKIKLAIDSIGEGQPDDYIISPSKHAQEFASKAPHLASVLNASTILMTARQYEKQDQDALEAQRTFKTVFNRANTTVLITGILVALILTISALSTSSDLLGRALLLALGIGSVIAGAIATRDLTVIKQGRLLEDWMEKRAFAETTRLAYFDEIAKTPRPANVPDLVSFELLKLEYFRRFQLDIQRAYYAKRCDDHRLRASRLLSYSSWSVAGATTAVFLAGLLGVVYSTKFGAIAALAAIFTALGTFIAMREAVFQDRRNAERYGRTCTVLENLYKRLDQVRKAVYSDGSKPLADFVDAVHEQLSLEHRQWLGEQSEAQGAFARLEKTLKETSAKIAPRDAA